MSSATLSEATKERWRTASWVADVLESEVRARRNPVVARVVSWLNLCRVCQDLEEQMLLATEASPGDQQLHRALLSTAIGSGESLLLEDINADTLIPLRLSTDSIAAKLESLRVTLAQWHSEMKLDRQTAILKEVFGGEV
jgi:hypothetical protein